MAQLEIRDVTRRIGDLVAVDDVSLNIEAGEFLTLLGPSGCGKTPLLRMIAGFDLPDAGQILLDESLAGSAGRHPSQHLARSHAGSRPIFFSDFIYTEIFVKSILMALATTLICLVMAYPLALLIARSPKKSRDLMVLLVILPFAGNFLIRVYAWMIVLGP